MTDNKDHPLVQIVTELRRQMAMLNELEAKIAVDPEYLPGHELYPKYCAEYLRQRDTWTMQEAINILLGCLPSRPLTLEGQTAINQQVELLKECIVACEGESLDVLYAEEPFDEWRVGGRHFLWWAKQKRLPIPKELGRFIVEEITPTSKFSYRGYSTRLLQIVGDVIEEYWVEFDVNDRGTYQKQTVIMDWLETKYGISTNEARAVDSIARPEALKKGGQSKIVDAQQESRKKTKS